MWILIVEAEYGTSEFLIQAETRPKFDDFWSHGDGEHVTSHRWVELKNKKETSEYTAWLL